MIMKHLENLLVKKLEDVKNQNNYRHLNDFNNYIDFSSNDYLGLARNLELKQISEEKIKNLHHKVNGSGGSRLISGHHKYIESIEKKIAEIHKTEAALLFNSGYNANMGVLSSLPQKNDVILYDEYCHASLKDGMRLSFADKYSFKHNNLDDLKIKLDKFNDKLCYIVLESVYSMDGDMAPLTEIVKITKENKTILVVDEAHSTGIMGKYGSGYTNFLNLEKEIDIRIHTYGKALGCHGAAVVGSENLKNYLINFSRPFIYTTALPLHAYASIETAYDYIFTHYETLQNQLKYNINSLVCKCTDIKFMHNTTPILCIEIPGNESCKKVAQNLQDQNIDVRAILSPTVQKGKERLRICMHTYNSEEEIVKLANALNKIQKGQ